ncbi:peroxidase 57-like [Phragmites australis]|uniref:peroxidase 57-like n=1 Tax=Phragmites australis TaxID=29695 RepID=UPI002D7669C2|nr:peroxidase 57-like [Phragmites australis]
MASAVRTGAAALVVALAVLALAGGGHAQLQYGFYKGKCNGSDVEAVVQGIVKARFARESPIVAYLLRMQFHECAVNGCDGGLLIDGPGTEKTAPPNLSVKGYDLIAAVKAELERRCPGVVSCSDIQILATRDAVALAGGPAYAVRTGRRDRRQSRASDVKLPAADYTAAQAVAYYAKLGLSAFDTVLLLGAHTVGATHCSAIKSSRLYRYGGKAGATDPGMDPTLASVYKKWVCPNVSSSDGNAVFLDDQWSALRVDNNYYKNLKRGRGVLLVDQNLYRDGSTRWIVDQLANNEGLFRSLFAQVLVKLSEVNVLTGAQGEIRKVCSKFN